MRVFITGATGFVGSHVARKLAEAGHDLRVLYRTEKKLAILEGLSYEGVAGDLDDLELLKRACDGCEIVFHVAAKADYWKDDDKDALLAHQCRRHAERIKGGASRRRQTRRLHKQRRDCRYPSGQRALGRERSLQSVAGALSIRLFQSQSRATCG